MSQVKKVSIAVIILAIIWTTFSTVPQAAGTLLIGDQTIYAAVDSNAAGHAEAFRATASASGTVTSLGVYVDPSSKASSMVAGLYADNGGTPGNLLTQGQLAHPAAGWNTVTVPAVNVTGGTVYWIAVLAPSGAGTLAFRDNGSNAIRSEERFTALFHHLGAAMLRTAFFALKRAAPGSTV
jgi:Domain of unknown function (DUF4082)